MRKLILGLIVLMITAVAVPLKTVQAITCTPTGFIRDGINMTAAQVDPSGTVSGEVDATGCNIGVYYSGVADGTIDGASIHGANYFGVVNNGANVDIMNSEIHHIGETPFNGAQHGVGIYFVYGTDASGTIANNNIWDYQKGGIVVNGEDATADVTGNTVTGLGPVGFIAQNGIQFGFGATVGDVSGNTVTGNIYTQTGGSGSAPDGVGSSVGVVSTGMLFLQAANSPKVGSIASSNHVYGNQANITVID